MCEPANAPQVQVSIKAVNLLHETKQLFQRALRTFAYFMASGSQYTLEGIDYSLYTATSQVLLNRFFAIYANVIEWMITETF